MPQTDRKYKTNNTPVSGEYRKVDPDDTGRYDLGVYSFVVETLQDMRLNCFWRVTPLTKGVMLYLYKRDEEERIFIESATAFVKLQDTLVTWADDGGISPMDDWFDDTTYVEVQDE